MSKIFTVVAALQGLILVGILAIIQSVVQAFQPAFHMPFSIWWGLLLSIPGLLMAFFVSKNFN